MSNQNQTQKKNLTSGQLKSNEEEARKIKAIENALKVPATKSVPIKAISSSLAPSKPTGSTLVVGKSSHPNSYSKLRDNAQPKGLRLKSPEKSLSSMFTVNIFYYLIIINFISLK
jgi:hypothetical protein